MLHTPLHKSRSKAVYHLLHCAIYIYQSTLKMIKFVIFKMIQKNVKMQVIHPKTQNTILALWALLMIVIFVLFNKLMGSLSFFTNYSTQKFSEFRCFLRFVFIFYYISTFLEQFIPASTSYKTIVVWFFITNHRTVVNLSKTRAYTDKDSNIVQVIHKLYEICVLIFDLEHS